MKIKKLWQFQPKIENRSISNINRVVKTENQVHLHISENSQHVIDILQIERQR